MRDLEGNLAMLSSEVDLGFAQTERLEIKMEKLQRSINEVASSFQNFAQNVSSSQFPPQGSYQFPTSYRPRPRCNHCGKNGHDHDSCWILHPQLRPMRRNEFNTSSNDQKN